MPSNSPNCGTGVTNKTLVEASIFLQVRLGSTRLPQKALLDLAGLCVIEHAMLALDAVPAGQRVLLTTDNSESKLLPIARNAGWDLFTGPEDDVLTRFVLASRHYRSRLILRATGDNPLVSAIIAKASLSLAAISGADYTGITRIPVGAGVEVLKAQALEDAHREAADAFEREHVAPFIYRRPQRYKIRTPDARVEYQDSTRITLDTEEDYIFLKKIFGELYNRRPIDLDILIPYLRREKANAG